MASAGTWAAYGLAVAIVAVTPSAARAETKAAATDCSGWVGEGWPGSGRSAARPIIETPRVYPAPTSAILQDGGYWGPAAYVRSTRRVTRVVPAVRSCPATWAARSRSPARPATAVAAPPAAAEQGVAARDEDDAVR